MTTLWRLVLVAPCGLPQTYEVRAPSESAAVAVVRRIKPEWTITEISRRQSAA